MKQNSILQEHVTNPKHTATPLTTYLHTQRLDLSKDVQLCTVEPGFKNRQDKNLLDFNNQKGSDRKSLTLLHEIVLQGAAKLQANKIESLEKSSLFVKDTVKN